MQRYWKFLKGRRWRCRFEHMFLLWFLFKEDFLIFALSLMCLFAVDLGLSEIHSSVLMEAVVS